MNLVTDSTGLVVMYSPSAAPTPPPGGALYALADASAFLAALAQPNSGIMFDGKTFTDLAPSVPPPPPVLTVDQKLAVIGLSVATLSAALNITAQPAPPAQQDTPA